jgi:hypothetical protein
MPIPQLESSASAGSALFSPLLPLSEGAPFALCPAAVPHRRCSTASSSGATSSSPRARIGCESCREALRPQGEAAAVARRAADEGRKVTQPGLALPAHADAGRPIARPGSLQSTGLSAPPLAVAACFASEGPRRTAAGLRGCASRSHRSTDRSADTRASKCNALPCAASVSSRAAWASILHSCSRLRCSHCRRGIS